MELVINNFGFSAGGWRTDKHPRMLADTTGDGVRDVVGFGDAGVYVARNNGDGTFAGLTLSVDNFGHTAGGWRVDRHPRFLADTTGDGLVDVVGCGYAGVYVSTNNGDGTFAQPTLALDNFGYTAGGWRVERHPRFVVDTTGDGLADVVGFGYAGVYVARNNGDGTFAQPVLAVDNFGYTAGGWRVDQHPRLLADTTGDGLVDVVGFGYAGVYVSTNNGDGTFAQPTLAVDNFGWTAGGWRVDRHPRFLADTTGDGLVDVVGCGDAGVWVSRNNGDGTFAQPTLAVANFGYDAGGWRVERHPRVLADTTGDGLVDVVGFGDAGVWVSAGNGDGTFAQPTRVIDNFAYAAGGWRVDMHPREVADVTGDGLVDLVGFGYAGMYVATNLGGGTFTRVRTRRDAWDLQQAGPWDPTTLSYAKAIQALQARPLTDPTSWQYQAAVHGRTGAVPAGATWNECQHRSWFFLSWHRMYLYWFERIVRAEVVRQGGSEDWALPYWNYSAPGRAAIPPAFREATLPDGTANPLFVPRAGGINNGTASLPPSATATAALATTAFVPSFGGGISPPAHFDGASGGLELTPHNIVHGLLGGMMVDPDLAALDPVFWLHHCNIDRLWEEWLAQGGRANPTDSAWLTTAFSFRDEGGALVQQRGADVVDTRGQLGYVYDTVPSQGDSPVLAAGPSLDGVGTPEAPEPELVGASERPVDLHGEPARVEVVVDRPSADAVERDGSTGVPATVVLALEDIRGDRNPAIGYEVFVATGAEGGTSHHVGTVSFFGIEHTSGDRDSDSPHGMRFTFDITDLARTLQARGHWDTDTLEVSFRPLGLVHEPSDATEGSDGPEASDEAEAAEAEAASRPVQIGRVGVFYG